MIRINFGALTPDQQQKALRLIYLGLFRETVADPALGFSVAQVTAAQNAADAAMAACRASTAPEFVVSTKQKTTGNEAGTQVLLNEPQPSAFVLNQIDIRVVEIDAQIVDLQVRLFTDEQIRTTMITRLEAAEDPSAVIQEAAVRVADQQNIQIQVQSLQEERQRFIDLKADLES